MDFTEMAEGPKFPEIEGTEVVTNSFHSKCWFGKYIGMIMLANDETN